MPFCRAKTSYISVCWPFPLAPMHGGETISSLTVSAWTNLVTDQTSGRITLPLMRQQKSRLVFGFLHLLPGLLHLFQRGLLRRQALLRDQAFHLTEASLELAIGGLERGFRLMAQMA